jgi:methanogenic corrinoid protein MtbC1
MEETMVKIVFPFLQEAGLLWQIGSIEPVHEHFASNIIKQKLYVAIDGNVGRYAENRKRFLLFLPEHEQHSLGLLFANYVLRSKGHEVLYLGQEVPMRDLISTFKDKLPDYIISILTAAHIDVDKQKFINDLSSYWKNSQILLTGSQFLNSDLQYPENVKLVERMEDFLNFVNGLSSNWSRN